MLAIEPESFLLTDIVINFSCALMCCLVWAQRREESCFAFWSAGFAVYSVAASIMTFSPGNPINDMAGFCLLSLHVAFIVAGFRAFDGSAPFTNIDALFVSVSPALYSFCGLFGFNFDVAYSISHVALLSYSLLQGAIIYDFDRHYASPRNVAAFVLSILPGVLLLKLFLGIDLVETQTVRWMLTLSHHVVTVVLIVVFFGVVSERQFEVIREMADHDPLTGVLNRSGLARALASGKSIETVILVDLDHFKSINDRFGHSVGDQVLRTFAERARTVIGPEDLVVRLGGEEFVIVRSSNNLGEAQRMADAILNCSRNRPVYINHQAVYFTVSIGITSRAIGDSVEDMLSRADVALYAAKSEGRDQARSSTPPLGAIEEGLITA